MIRPVRYRPVTQRQRCNGGGSGEQGSEEGTRYLLRASTSPGGFRIVRARAASSEPATLPPSQTAPRPSAAPRTVRVTPAAGRGPVPPAPVTGVSPRPNPHPGPGGVFALTVRRSTHDHARCPAR
ncbi:hypothetical protein DBP21_35305 [Streptomyces sp. CS147]|nr:hypothetical protein DBP21_35305 [Streptomyces sp. CS147]